MNLPLKQIEFRKKVGSVDGVDLFHIKTKGGLHVIAKSSGEVIGSGPHRAVARHIAQRHEPGLTWTELSKHDHCPLETYAHLLPDAEANTDELRRLQAEALK